MRANQINDLWKEQLTLLLGLDDRLSYSDMEKVITDVLAAPEATSQVNDNYRVIAALANGTWSHVDPVHAHGRVGLALLTSELSIYDLYNVTRDRNDIWRKYLERGGYGVQGYADLTKSINITNTQSGTTVAGTYIRTDANGTVYYDDGTGVLFAAANNTPYRHKDYGMYFEAASTNRFTYANDLSNAAWVKTNATRNVGTVAPPTGAGLADLMLETAALGLAHIWQHSVTKSAASAFGFTYSAYVKAAGRTRCQLRVNATGATTNRIDVSFDLNTGTVVSAGSLNTFTGATGRITKLNGDWYRIEASGLSSTEVGWTTTFYLQNDAGNILYDGDITKGMHVWGQQIEEIDIATTLMASVASQCSRSVGQLTYPVTAYDILPAPGNPFSFSAELMDIRTTQAAALGGRVYHVIGETSRFLRKVSGGSTFNATYGNTAAVGTVAQNRMVRLRHSVAISPAGANLAQNAALIGTQSTVNAITGTATALRIGSSGAATDVFHGFIKKFSIHNAAIVA